MMSGCSGLVAFTGAIVGTMRDRLVHASLQTRASALELKIVVMNEAHRAARVFVSANAHDPADRTRLWSNPSR